MPRRSMTSSHWLMRAPGEMSTVWLGLAPSAAGIFTGDTAENLGGSFDNDADNNIFKATFGRGFGPLSFGNVAQTGLSEDFIRNDLTIVGSLFGGGDLGPVDIIYIPEPSSLVLLLLAAFALLARRRVPSV